MRKRMTGNVAVLLLLTGGIFFTQWPFNAFGASAIQWTQVHASIIMWLLLVLIIGLCVLLTLLAAIHDAIIDWRMHQGLAQASAPRRDGIEARGGQASSEA